MAKAGEVSQNQLASGLQEGVDTLSLSQTIDFTLYNRYVLPVDGYVFWVKDPSNTVQSVKGSIHYGTKLLQNPDEYFGQNQVIFTAESEIQAFNTIGPNQLYIGTFNNAIRFAFSERAPLYVQAGLFHYRGEAINPVMFPQIIDNPATLSTLQIATNSLPLWLALQAIMPIYPAHLVPQNAIPPYASVEIKEDTEALGMAPLIDINTNHTQLIAESVEIVIYGVRNNDILDFQDYLFQYTLDTDAFGIMNMPVVKDRKRTQSELGMVAVKKSMDCRISYYQSRAQSVARQLILSAQCAFAPDPYGLLDSNFTLNQSVLA